MLSAGSVGNCQSIHRKNAEGLNSFLGNKGTTIMTITITNAIAHVAVTEHKEETAERAHETSVSRRETIGEMVIATSADSGRGTAEVRTGGRMIEERKTETHSS